MKTSALQLLPSTSHGTPSGNYDGSSLDFGGVRQKAASYYLSGQDLQTVAFFLTGFVGYITIQATLDSDPTTDSQWFDVYDITSDGSTAITNNFSTNITGNFTWIRAYVSGFNGGTINKVTLSY